MATENNVKVGNPLDASDADSRASIETGLRLQAVGSLVLRYGLVLVVGWIGLMKFTEYEAKGIQPFVAHSPLMSKKVDQWLTTAARTPGFIGFAVGRTVFWEPLVEMRDKKISRDAAVAEVARRYQALVDIFEEARA